MSRTNLIQVLAPVAVFVLLAAPAGAAIITVDTNGVSASGTSSSGTTSQSWTHTSAASGEDGLVLVFIAREGASLTIPPGDPVIYSATYDGQSMTFVPDSGCAAERSSTQPEKVLAIGAWYYPIDDTGGSKTVALNFPSANGSVFGTAITLWGVDQSDPIDSVANSIWLAITGPSTNITTTVSDVMVVDFLAENTGSKTFTAGANQTKQWEDGANNWGVGGAMSTRDVSTAGTVTNTWTISAAPNRSAHLLVGVNPIPEPATLGLMALGGAGLLALRRKRR